MKQDDPVCVERPVRDVDETLGEVDAALSEAQEVEDRHVS